MDRFHSAFQPPSQHTIVLFNLDQEKFILLTFILKRFVHEIKKQVKATLPTGNAWTQIKANY